MYCLCVCTLDLDLVFNFVTNVGSIISPRQLERYKLEAYSYFNFVTNIVAGAKIGAKFSNYHLCLFARRKSVMLLSGML